MLIATLCFIGFILIVSIAGIYSWHSQEMAKLKGTPEPTGSDDELTQMKREMAELRQMITSLAINVENMKDNYIHSSALEDRMKVGE
jgi:cell division protein FtsB